MNNSPRELTPGEVAFSISTEEVERLSGGNGNSHIIGQPRAVQALQMGLEIRAKGYNVFVSGLPGTGKRTAIYRLLEQYKQDQLRLRDIALVYNFRSPFNPSVLYFPQGTGAKFRKDVTELVENVRLKIARKLRQEDQVQTGDQGENQDIRQDTPLVEQFPAAELQEIAGDISAYMDPIRANYPGDEIRKYLDDFEEDLARNLFIFTQEEPVRDETGSPAFLRYGVNLLVNHENSTSYPVIFEKHPTYPNLFGSMDPIFEPGGESRTNFMMIRAGSLIQASGGYLILQAEDLVDEEESWNSLKWALRDCRVDIQPQAGQGNMPAPHLKPEPIEIDVKVIMMGNDQMYDILYSLDEDFSKLFKLPAEFDSVMQRNDQSTAEYITFMKKIVSAESLKPLDYSGMAAVIEYGIRLSERRDQLSTRFSLIADILREADFWAGKIGEDRITRKAVDTSLEKRIYLFNLPEEKIDEQILTGELLIQVAGSEVGKVNGLAILDRGFYSFGRPALITARVAPGNDGVVNIERESGLSGDIHDKGMLIIEGFLRARYARNVPLSITASLCFEQSYIEIDGDSASSAEAYVLLSAIADVPLRLDTAVTGSFSQMGEIQPIGGVTEKVEGFYTVCKKLGLTGTQGVIIPKLNTDSLILSREVQEAVNGGRFHIYPVSRVDEGLEILTGMDAGEPGPKGAFPPGTFNHIVEKRLKEFAGQVKAHGGS